MPEFTDKTGTQRSCSATRGFSVLVRKEEHGCRVKKVENCKPSTGILTGEESYIAIAHGDKLLKYKKKLPDLRTVLISRTS